MENLREYYIDSTRVDYSLFKRVITYHLGKDVLALQLQIADTVGYSVAFDYDAIWSFSIINRNKLTQKQYEELLNNLSELSDIDEET